MEIVENSLLFGGLLTLLITVGKCAISIHKYIRKKEKWQETIEKHVFEDHLSILRLTIFESEMPLEERIKAGDSYIKAGGNGAVKQKYNELLKTYSNS